MEKTESKKGDSLLDNNFSPKNSTWLSENLQDTHNTFEQLKRLIEECGNAQVDCTDSSEQKGTQLTGLVQEFYKKYQSLAEHFDLMSGKLQKAMPDSVSQSESKEVLDFGLEESSPEVTPKQTPHPPRSVNHDFSSPGNSSFGISLKEGSESSSRSSDTESESSSSCNIYLGPVKHKKKREQHEFEALYTKEDDDALQQKNMYGNCQELIVEVEQSEEQLMVLKQKLQRSEDESKLLKIALDKSKSIAHGLQAQLEAANAEIKIKGSNLALARAKTLELEEHIVPLISNSDHNMKMLKKDLNLAEEKLTIANEASASLLAQLDSEKKLAAELQERISGYTYDLCNRECEILELQHALSEAQMRFTIEKEQLLSSNSSLVEKQQEAEARLMELVSSCVAVKAKLRHCEEENQSAEVLHDAQLSRLQVDLDQLKKAVTEKNCQIDCQNRDLDRLKLRLDMTVAEKDELNARIETLLAELRCRDIHIEEFSKGSANADKLVWELRSRVEEVEKEVDLQKVVISEGAEKKKEAIRQLCFSLEHYRSRYHELHQTFVVHKRHAALAL